MRRILRFRLLVISALPLHFAYATAGDADPTFGNGAGYVTYAAPYEAQWLISGGTALPDGSAILAGHAETPLHIRHYLRDGTLDAGFGSAGTAVLSDFAYSTSVHVYPGANGTILLEQSGVVRRLSANGQYDSTYSQRKLNLAGASSRDATLLPQPDGRFIVVTGQQAPTPTQQISVRYSLADGSPDTVRGDVDGERLVYPGGAGTYNPTGAAMQADGKLLIAAVLSRPGLDTDMVLIRLNADGSYDNGFGQSGMVTVAAQVGSVGIPSVTVGSNGQIAYMFGVGDTPPSYFVVYVLRADGTVDTSAPGGGRISVPISDPSITTTIITYVLSFASPPPKLAVRMPRMLWQFDLGVGGAVPPPRYSSASLGADFSEFGFAFGGDTLWVFGGEVPIVYGSFANTPLVTYQRGVAVPYDAPNFGVAAPPRVSASVPSTYQESFDDLQLQPDGGMLLLGRSTKFTSPFVLTKFRTDGTVDTGYAAGAGRVIVPTSTTGEISSSLLKAADGSATVLALHAFCGRSNCTRTGSLFRYLPSGAADLAFGGAGTATLPDYFPFSSGNDGSYFAGFVDGDGAATIVTLSNTQSPLVKLQPLRYGQDGKATPGFNGAAQSALLVNSGLPDTARVDRLPDGRLQAIVPYAGNQQISLNTFRWLANGAVDPALPAPATTVLPAADQNSSALDLDAMVLPDGSTIVAIWQTSQRIILRLDASGRQDMHFGNAGTARIDGVVTFPSGGVPRLRLAVQADGKILLAYSVRLSGGTAIAVARFLADGQPDNTITADGRFDSIFYATGAETASGIARLPDGKLMIAGAIGGRGLLLRLKGESVPVVQVQSVIEFFNTALGHYFITADASEAAAIDHGSAGPEWQRTGKGFVAWTPAGGVPDGSLPVCRFYGTPGRGPNSHFYTVNANECATVKNDPGWTYEGIAFYAFAPISEQCAGAWQRVYRAYNNRYAQNDSNHRYAVDLSVLQPLVSHGWTIEGAVFCVPAN